MKKIKTFIAPIAAAVILIGGLIGKTAEESGLKLAEPVTLEKLKQIPADVFTRIIDRSTSPNEQLAVAFGSVDGSDPNWEGYADGRGGLFHDDAVLPEFSYSLENGRTYLLDMANNRITGILDSRRLGTRSTYNHESGRIAWSPDSRWLVESQSWKWYTKTCTVHRLSTEGALGARLDFEAAARKIVDEKLREISPKSTQEERNRYAVTVYASGISNEGILTAKIYAEIPKATESEYVDLSISVEVKERVDGKLFIGIPKVSLQEN